MFYHFVLPVSVKLESQASNSEFWRDTDPNHGFHIQNLEPA